MDKSKRIDRIAIRNKLSGKLTPFRFEHTLGVEYTCTALAMCYHVDLEKAALAGLLHDCAKHLSTEKRFRKCIENNIPISEYEQRNPELLHAKLGAFLARTKYGIEDKEIISAIECHTTGKPDMTTLEKILYIADYIEPNRNKAPKLAFVRHMAFRDLDECLLAILESTIGYLQATGTIIDDVTTLTYQYYKTKTR